MNCFKIVLENQIRNVKKEKSYYVGKATGWVKPGYLEPTESIYLLEVIQEVYPNEEPQLDKKYYFDLIAKWSADGLIEEDEAVELITMLEEKYPDKEITEEPVEEPAVEEALE